MAISLLLFTLTHFYTTFYHLFSCLCDILCICRAQKAQILLLMYLIMWDQYFFLKDLLILLTTWNFKAI